jgi:hypothetical protein
MTISSQVICSRHDAAEKLFISAIKLQTLTMVFCRVRVSLKKFGEKHQINNLVAGRRNIKGPNPISFTIYGFEHITCFTQIHIFHILFCKL